MTTPCTCGNCPAIRMERGLLPFCALPRDTKPRPKPGFGTRAECEAAHPDHGAVERSLDPMGHGPRRWFPTIGRKR